MIPINYHHLYYFWTVARCGSIAAAKERLFLSQPTLSSQLKELEDSCRLKLFERGRRGVTLTPGGEMVFGYCETIFSAGDELVAALNKGLAGPSVLRVGIDSTISSGVIVRLLDFARRRDRSVRIAVFNGDRDALAGRLRRRALDFVVLNEDAAVQLGRDFESRLACSLPVHFVASPAVKKKLRSFPAGLSHVPMLLKPPDNPVRRQVDQYLGRHRIVANVEADLEDADLIRRLAVEGRGVAVMNDLALAPDLRGGRLVKLHKGSVNIKEPLWFVRGRRGHSNAALQAMIDALMEKFRLQEARA